MSSKLLHLCVCQKNKIIKKYNNIIDKRQILKGSACLEQAYTQ